MSNAIDRAFETATVWREEAFVLRAILKDCALEETLKWGKPCYVHQGRNIAIIQRMKDYLALMFFKGALLDDPDGLLKEQGPNSRSARRLEFTGTAEIAAAEARIRALVASAIKVEKAGLKVDAPADPALPAELTESLAEDPALDKAFNALTPGRQRGYALHIGSARQKETRRARIARLRDRILAGKGLHDR